MIDNFALGLIHFLLAVTFWRLLMARALDRDDDEAAAPPPLAPRKKPARRP